MATDKIGLHNLFECCAKRGYQLMRELSNEANSVRYQNRTVSAELNSSNKRIESGEKPVRHKSFFTRESPEKSRLSGVGVAHERNHR